MTQCTAEDLQVSSVGFCYISETHLMKPRSVESMYFTCVTREPLLSKDTEEIFTLLVSLLGTPFLLLTAHLSSQ